MMHCSDDQLIALIDDPAVGHCPSDEVVAIAHLEHCEACQSRLAELSGEGDWLVEWLDSVRQDTCEFVDTSHAPSVVITTDRGDPMEVDGEIQCDAVRLDFLEAPRHPELLGRLGRYDIEQLIGMGGFGVVFKARDSELNRVVAIKALAPHLMTSGPARKRFAREAQASAAVVHDHVVAIHDVVSQSEASYFVMQYVAGDSLQQRVDRDGPLPTEDVLRIAGQMASALQAAHEQGLIHRDVKPGNVLLEDSVDRVLISDFGLARTADDASITRSGVISGTPHYMSPEQSRGEAIDTRSDLFSLGSVIYFMCTGHPPFRAPRMMAVLNRICHEPHRALDETDAAVPVEVSEIVDRLLAKDPDERYASAEQVRQDLNQLLRDLQSGVIRPRRNARRASHGWRNAAVLSALVAIVLVWFGWTQLRGPLPVTVGEAKIAADPLATRPLTAEAEDPFPDELNVTQRLLEELEVPPAISVWGDDLANASWSWQRQMTELDMALSDLEKELGAEADMRNGQ